MSWHSGLDRCRSWLHNSGGCGGGGRSRSFDTLSSDKDKSKSTGARSAGNTSVLVGVCKSVSGASGDTHLVVDDIGGSTVGTHFGGIGSDGDIDVREAVNGDG